MTPTTELVLSHKHPADRQQVAATLEEMRRTHRTFSTRHRIIDTRGEVHEVVVIGDRLTDDAGRLIGTHGFYVDVTPTAAMTKAMVTAALTEITENRAVIEQAKGMLMLIYRSTPRPRSSCCAGVPRSPTSSSGCWPSRCSPTTRRWCTRSRCRRARRSTICFSPLTSVSSAAAIP